MNTTQPKQKFLPASRSRKAFTLIELLLVMSIIAVLASLAVGVISSAQEDSRIAATRARVLLIQRVMQAELEDYEVRRSPIPFAVIRDLTVAIPESQWVGSTDPATDRNFLLHAKNLKRIIVADLIRSEFPSGRNGQPPNLGTFPSTVLNDYLIARGITQNDINSVFERAQSANVARWGIFLLKNSFSPAPTSTDLTEAEVAQLRADSSEVMYEFLSQIEFDGTNVIDSLGASAVGDSDSDQVNEIVDAFGDPLAFEFQQRNIEPKPQTIPITFPQTGVWALDTNGFAFENFETVKPILPTDLRIFITSEKLLEIDGEPVDLEP